jgi:hypothetical protein
MSSDSEDINTQIAKLQNELKQYEKSESEEEVIKIVEKPKKSDGRSGKRSEKQIANLAKMRDAKLIKGAEKKRNIALQKQKDDELKEELNNKKIKNEYKKKFKKKYASSSSSSSTEIVKKKKKKKHKKKVSSSSSGSVSPLFKMDGDAKAQKVPAWMLE